MNSIGNISKISFKLIIKNDIIDVLSSNAHDRSGKVGPKSKIICSLKSLLVNA